LIGATQPFKEIGGWRNSAEPRDPIVETHPKVWTRGSVDYSIQYIH